MSASYIDPGGAIAAETSLQLPRAQAFASTVWSRRLAFVTPVECRCNDDGSECVIIEVEVERPQQLDHPIHRIERIAVRFRPGDDWYPEILALRPDFPRAPHQYLRPEEFPRSLCLYDQPWPQVAMHWTPTTCIERIRYWLAETAKGTLHQSDQPLEPLFSANGWSIVLPPETFTTRDQLAYGELAVAFPRGVVNGRVLLANPEQSAAGVPYVALSFLANPQTHGIIRQQPRTLQELNAFVINAGIPLVEHLRKKLRESDTPDFRKKQMLIIIAFPLMREAVCAVEAADVWAFLTSNTVEEVSIAIGIRERLPGGQLGHVLQPNSDADGRTTLLDILSPQFMLTREKAAVTNGTRPDTSKVVAIGLGALGSQVVRLLAQAGFGTWTLIDEDVLFPHNFARHALGPGWMGWSKGQSMAVEIDHLYKEATPSVPIDADILRPGDRQETIQNALSEAEIVLDMAASIPVTHHLVHGVNSPARRAAVFLNPRGTDLVLLAEDKDRSIPLDCLEMQYYRAIATNPEFEQHLLPPESRLRYARSCRDVTATLPNHLVTLHAAIAARALRLAIDADTASIRIWQADTETGAVRTHQCKVTPVRRGAFGDWTLVLDHHVIAQLTGLRLSKLPNETGGVLLGSYDLTRKIVYVVDTIPSPPDSKEWPTLYIRGSAGLLAQVEHVRHTTYEQLEYIGEWHSHPDGCPCAPSDDDLLVFSWLTANLADAGLPALMSIAGEGGGTAWFLGEMQRTGGWAPEQ